MITGRVRPQALPLAVFWLIALGWAFLFSPRRAQGQDVRGQDAGVAPRQGTRNHLGIRLGSSGTLAAWLVAGPFRGASGASPSSWNVETIEPSDASVTASPLAAALGHPVAGLLRTTAKESAQWAFALANRGGAVDLTKYFGQSADSYVFATAELLVQTGGQYRILVGADDGFRIFLDGTSLGAHQGRYREDGSMYAVALSPGLHRLHVKVSQRVGAWSFRTRLLGEHFEPIGDRIHLQIPGAGEPEQATFENQLSQVHLTRGVDPLGYTPTLRVEFPDGVPEASPIAVRVDAPGYISMRVGTIAPQKGDLQALLPRVSGAELASFEAGPHPIEISVGQRKVSLMLELRQHAREALALAATARTANANANANANAIDPESVASFELLTRRLTEHVDSGDSFLEAQESEASELRAAATTLLAGTDPFAHRTGPQRRAYVSPVDHEFSEFGLYVPPSLQTQTQVRAQTEKKTRLYPLIVALHGLNGKPMAMMRWLFGNDDAKHEQDWEDRHMGTLPALDAFVLTPDAHGNSFYRNLGEDDVMRLIDWALAKYPIDPTRISITGPSMGGIGAAALAFRFPNRFAAAAPLCGYHSYLIRGDVAKYNLSPWERFLVEERSNVEWAENGRGIPLYIVHGTRDLPEANSGVLIERYEQLYYTIKHEHPDLGHNVWQPTYEGLAGAHWLTSYKRRDSWDVRFRTSSPRYGESGFIRITELEHEGRWAKVDAHLQKNGDATVRTENIAEIRISEHLANAPPDGSTMHLRVDSSKLSFAPNEARLAYKDGQGWHSGPRPDSGPRKRERITGPIRDIFHSPITFVYGKGDRALEAASEWVAKSFAHGKPGTNVHYPVMSDLDFLRRGESISAPRALFLVGTSQSNALIRTLEAGLPWHVEGSSLIAKNGTRRTGPGLGVTFIHPNPMLPSEYVVVVTGTDAEGIFRSLSLPDLVPDYVVYDASLAQSRGETVLGPGKALEAGFFAHDWSLAPAQSLLTRAPPIPASAL